jgi:hypothetical protein
LRFSRPGKTLPASASIAEATRLGGVLCPVDGKDELSIFSCWPSTTPCDWLTSLLIFWRSLDFMVLPPATGPVDGKRKIVGPGRGRDRACRPRAICRRGDDAFSHGGPTAEMGAGNAARWCFRAHCPAARTTAAAGQVSSHDHWHADRIVKEPGWIQGLCTVTIVPGGVSREPVC